MAKKSVKNYSELTFDEQKKLVSDYIENKPGAEERLYNQYANMVIKFANKYSGYDFKQESLVSEATIGLLKAAKNYDETKGASFFTYAYGYLQWYISDYVENYGKKIKMLNNPENLALDANEEDFVASSETDVETACIDNDLRQKLKNIIMNLPEPKKTIMQNVGIDEISYNKVGEKLGLSGERIRQIFNDTVNELKKKFM